MSQDSGIVNFIKENHVASGYSSTDPSKEVQQPPLTYTNPDTAINFFENKNDSSSPLALKFRKNESYHDEKAFTTNPLKNKKELLITDKFEELMKSGNYILNVDQDEKKEEENFNQTNKHWDDDFFDNELKVSLLLIIEEKNEKKQETFRNSKNKRVFSFQNAGAFNQFHTIQSCF